MATRLQSSRPSVAAERGEAASGGRGGWVEGAGGSLLGRASGQAGVGGGGPRLRLQQRTAHGFATLWHGAARAEKHSFRTGTGGGGGGRGVHSNRTRSADDTAPKVSARVCALARVARSFVRFLAFHP